MNKYKMIALNYCYDGKADLTGLTKEEIRMVLRYVTVYNGDECSKFFVPENKRQVIISCETLTDLINSAIEISNEKYGMPIPKH